MQKSQNWINDIVPNLSLNDKVKILLKPSNSVKLVLVQQQELERLKPSTRKDNHAGYIDGLYEHYIVNNLPKTYLCTPQHSFTSL